MFGIIPGLLITLEIVLIVEETDNYFFLNKSVTDGTSLRCDGKLVEDFPFPAAKSFPWDLHPLSNYQLQHGKPAARNFVVFDSNVHFLPD